MYPQALPAPAFTDSRQSRTLHTPALGQITPPGSLARFLGLRELHKVTRVQCVALCLTPSKCLLLAPPPRPPTV